MDHLTIQSWPKPSGPELRVHILVWIHTGHYPRRRIHERYVSHQQEGHASAILLPSARRLYRHTSRQIHPQHLPRWARNRMGRRILQLQEYELRYRTDWPLPNRISDFCHHIEERQGTLGRNSKRHLQIQQTEEGVRTGASINRHGRRKHHLSGGQPTDLYRHTRIRALRVQQPHRRTENLWHKQLCLVVQQHLLHPAQH